MGGTCASENQKELINSIVTADTKKMHLGRQKHQFAPSFTTKCKDHAKQQRVIDLKITSFAIFVF